MSQISVFCSESYYNPPVSHMGGWRPFKCWATVIPWPRPAAFTTDVDQYLAATSLIKIAFYKTNHWPEPGEGPQDDWQVREKHRIERLAQASDLLFVVDDEIMPGGLADDSDLRQFHNIYWVIPAYVKGLESQVIPYQYHLWRIRDLYENQIHHYLPKLDPYAIKPFYFDAMLGTRKSHRVQVYHAIAQNNLQHKILSSIGPSPGTQLGQSMFTDPAFYVEPDWIALPGSDYLTLNQAIMIGNAHAAMPNVLPIELYNRTAYSIVCETWHDNSALMITEKLAKALLARRLFVVFSGAGYLRLLRDEGFRTFSHIIDESYDDIEDNQERWTRAFDQVKRLCDLPQQEVLDQIRPTVEHNYMQLMSCNLAERPFNRMNEIIQAHVSTKI